MWFERQRCRACLSVGISCESRDWRDDRAIKGVSSVILSERLNRSFQCLEPIRRCPVILGRLSVEKTAGNIKHVINEVGGFVIQPVLVSRSSNETKIPGIDS